MVAQSTYYMYIKSKAALPIHLKLTQEWLQNAVDHSVEQIAPIIIISIISTEKWQDTKTKKMPCTQQRKVVHTHTTAPSSMHCLAGLKVSLLCSHICTTFNLRLCDSLSNSFAPQSLSHSTMEGYATEYLSAQVQHTAYWHTLYNRAHPYQTYMM